MAKYLVTGGCGFIGSHLCERLLGAGHEVRVLDDLSNGKRENIPRQEILIVGNVADAATVRAAMAGMDGCFHLAAVASIQRSIEDWLGTHATNLTGAITVFDAARSHGRIPVVYASSAAVYGDNPALPLDEAAVTRPLSAYGADKLGCELHARVATLVHGVPTTGFRFFNVFGPRQDPDSPYSGVISIFTRRLMNQEALTVFGDGLQSRDFIYVGDVVDYLTSAMQQPALRERVLNVCTGQATTLRDLIATLGELLDITPVVRLQPSRIGDIRESLGSPELCRQTLGCAKKTSLREGLAATMAFISSK
ncbi:MAG: NAD-dependent epimerase/dehydratase family protein [Alphaproteobacteria bacterium]|nr:NAD-dependent epimerase/dehydratase family protein [Alphaproteobacteria bacterium]